MGKKKKTPVDDATRLQNLKRSNKIITKDGKVKKKILKQFTDYQCSVCNKRFTDKYNLSTHEKIHQNEQFPCTVCPYVGKTKKYLARHKRSAHSAPRHECGVCGRAFHHPSGLKEHAMVHTGEKPLKCEICGKAFRVSYSLNSHMLIHKNEKPFKCSFCDYACRDNSTLRRHEHRHMGIIKMFTCKICPKKFDSRPKLKYHISEVHLDYLNLDLKRHACEKCGKTFKLKANMVKHVQIVHGATPCACPLCGKLVKHEAYLPRHLRSHFPERPHVCAHDGCGKAFKDKGDLKKHSMIHAWHLHAACALCGATFARAYRLQAHMRVHEPREKSVTCDYCSVQFYSKNYLIKHIKQKHSADKQRFICEHCGLVTYNKPSIVMHLKYGQCRKNELRCKICKTTYKHLVYLRSHYLKTHKMRYKPIKRRIKKETKKPMIEIKVEPVEDPYEDVKLSMLEVSKEEIEVEEEGNMENDLISYSNNVLSEDLQEYLLKDDSSQDRPGNSFDEFLLRHVFHKQVKEEPETRKEETDKQQAAIVAQKIKDVIAKAKEDEAKKIIEEKKKRQAKILERKLKREAKMMRRKKRRERFELERVRQLYNDRIRKAATESLKKEPAKKIKYFQQKNYKEVHTDKEATKTNNNYKNNIGVEGSLNDDNKDDSNDDNAKNNVSNNINETNNSTNAKNTEKELNTDKTIDLSNNNDKVSDIIDFENGTKIYNNKNEPINDENNCTNKKQNMTIIDKGTNNKETDINDDHNCTKDTGINDDQNGTNDKLVTINDCQNSTNYKDISINDDQNRTKDEDIDINDDQNCTNDKTNSTNDGNNTINGEHNRTDDVDNGTSKSNGIDDDDTVSGNDDDKNYDSDSEKSESGSNYEPNSEDEATPNKKMKFRTHQCYVCFKLYPTKEELMSHCESHFDICNSTTLSKCPACGHVVSRNMAKHMRVKHGIHITIPHSKISKRKDDEQGSKYCYKMADTVVEIIPSVKMLNHTASIEIDKRNRERRDKTVAKTRLVKKGTEWIVENYAASVSFQEMPEFTEQELSKLPVSEGYIERLGALSKLARKKGVKIMFPCQKCDKICQNFCALKLHGRRHDPNKKPFAPRQNKRNAKQTVTEKPKVKSTENRLAKPRPIKNKHKCDEKLKRFYETHIRGADIEFWQFLKIYNKMNRDNIKDFSDLECKPDFGKNIYGSSTEIDQTKTESSNEKSSKTQKSVNRKDINKIKITSSVQQSNKTGSPSKLAQQNITKKPLFKRVIMISRKQHLEREKAKTILREKIKGNI